MTSITEQLRSHKGTRIFLYIVLLVAIIWGLLNIGSYIFVKKYLASDEFKRNLIKVLYLDPDKKYYLNAKPNVIWGPLYINVSCNKFEFYDEYKQDIDININQIDFLFSIARVFMQKFIPSMIKANNGTIKFNAKSLEEHYLESNKESAVNVAKIRNIKKIRFFELNNIEINLIDNKLDESKIKAKVTKNDVVNTEIKEGQNILASSQMINYMIKNLTLKNRRSGFKLKLDYSDNKYIYNAHTLIDGRLSLKNSFIQINKQESVMELYNIDYFEGAKSIKFNSVSTGIINLRENSLIPISGKLNIIDGDGIILKKDELDSNDWQIKNLSADINYLDNGKNILDIANFKCSINDRMSQTSKNWNDIDGSGKVIIAKDANNIIVKLNFPKSKTESSNINPRNLLTIWPKRFFVDTKKWFMKSIFGGNITDGSLDLNLFYDKEWKFKEKNSKHNGNFTITEGAMLCCGKYLPLIENINGTLKFDSSHLSGDASSGLIKKQILSSDLDNNKEEVAIDDIKAKDIKVWLDFNKTKLLVKGYASGKAHDFVNLYDPNFKVNILNTDVIKRMKGDASGTFEVSTNLSQKTKNGDLIVEKHFIAHSDNIETSIEEPKFLLKNNKVDFKFDGGGEVKNHIDIKMNGLLNDQKFVMNSAGLTDVASDDPNYLKHNVKFKAKYADAKDLVKRVIGPIASIDGEVEVGMDIINNKDGTNKFNVDLDLVNTDIKAPYLKIHKRPKDNANAKFNLLYSAQNDQYDMTNFHMKLPKHIVSIDSLLFRERNREINVVGLKINKTLIDSISYFNECDTNINHACIDASQIVYHDFDWFAFENEDADADENTEIKGSIKTLLMADDLKLKNLNLNLDCDKGECHTIILDNICEKGRSPYLNASLISNILNVYSDDAGLILRGLDLTKYIKSGEMILKGFLNQYNCSKGNNAKYCDKAKKQKKLAMLESQLDIKNFFVTNVSAAAKLVSIASLSDTINNFLGKGITFKSLRSNFIYFDEKVQFAQSIADGPSIGLTFDGMVDVTKETLDMKGSLMPFNFINMFLRHIPGIGKLLVGNPGDGLFSIDFHLSGKLDKPEYKINPLKMFTPYIVSHTLEKGIENGKQNKKAIKQKAKS